MLVVQRSVYLTFFPGDFTRITYLIYLKLSRCSLTEFSNTTFSNLQVLDLSDNFFEVFHLEWLLSMKYLRYITLSKNPITKMIWGQNTPLRSTTIRETSTPFLSVVHLDMSNTVIPDINEMLLSEFPSLQHLNISGTQITMVKANAFAALNELKQIDISRNMIEDFPGRPFRGLSHLSSIFAGDIKVCCRDNLPAGFNIDRCVAPVDEVFSCDDLLRSQVYRVCLWVLAFLAVAGNVYSFW